MRGGWESIHKGQRKLRVNLPGRHSVPPPVLLALSLRQVLLRLPGHTQRICPNLPRHATAVSCDPTYALATNHVAVPGSAQASRALPTDPTKTCHSMQSPPAVTQLMHLPPIMLLCQVLLRLPRHPQGSCPNLPQHAITVRFDPHSCICHQARCCASSGLGTRAPSMDLPKPATLCKHRQA